YDKLVDIICNPKFKNADVITTIYHFRKYQQRLPLLPIKLQNIHISNKKMPSTSKDTREINIWKESSRFGQGFVQINKTVYKCGEFIVYKDLIVENKYDRILSIVNIDDKLKAIFQHILMFNKLPNNLQSNSQRERSHNELWLLDREIDNSTIIIELQSIDRVLQLSFFIAKII
ncbi:5396_t:CDS:2, partial [Cetraspora pellucida]